MRHTRLVRATIVYGICMAKLLIIEDDELIQRMYKQVFEMRGHQVSIANNGEEGLEQAKAVKPTLILLDIMMPRMNGLDMLKRIKALPGLAHIPIMILTNLMGAADAQTALTNGALKYVIKSDYTPQEVGDIVENLLAGISKQAPEAA